ncbi:MAG: hypothetical protein RI996_29 [Candidatus Parcubacteria bacterium]|jgi:PhnB protein
MATIYPLIHFNGNCEEAFMFYKSIFGGEFSTLTRFKDFPDIPNPNAEIEADNIMHISLSIGADSFLMGSDTPSYLGTHNLSENRSKIYIRCQSKKEADDIFRGLSEGVIPEMPIGDSPWGSYFGMLRDMYGVEWMIDFDTSYNTQK